MTYNPDVLQGILRARSLSRKALSARLGIDADELDEELQREPAPKQGLLNNIARELGLPPFVFYMSKSPNLGDSILDFRSAQPAPSPKQRSTTESIHLAMAVQKAAIELAQGGAQGLPHLSDTALQGVAKFALVARNHFQISLDDQLGAANARTFYSLCRKKIETKGIFVLQDSFPDSDGSGFCLAHNRHPVIVINTKKQTRGRRLFTLIHEIGHVLMGQTGISDPFIKQNVVEKICNHFASSFLIPEAYADELLAGIRVPSEPNIDDVARIAKRTKISQQATVLRLEELGIVKAGSHDRWLKALHNIGNPDFSERGGGAGGPPPQEKVKLAKYGFRLAQAFEKPLREGELSEINLYRATGLKPKYQLDYFNYAKSITDAELRTLELEDD